MSHLDCYAPLTYHDTPSMNICYHDLSAREHGQSGSIYDPAEVPFDYQRLPRSNDYLCSLSVEGMGVTLEYSLYLARPYGTRKCWSIWCVIYASPVEFIDQRTAASPIAYISANADDDPEDIGRFLLLAALEVLNEDSTANLTTKHRKAYYHSISSGLLSNEQIYAALLTTHTTFGDGMHDPEVQRSQTQAIIDATFSEFQDRVAERLSDYFARKE